MKLNPNLKLKALLTDIDERLERREFFFLFASNGEVRILDAVTDFGDAVYLEMGAGLRKDLMANAIAFLAEYSLSHQTSEKLDRVLARNLLKT